VMSDLGDLRLEEGRDNLTRVRGGQRQIASNRSRSDHVSDVKLQPSIVDRTSLQDARATHSLRYYDRSRQTFRTG